MTAPVESTMEHFRRTARRTRSQVARLDQRRRKTSGRGIQRCSGAHHAVTDDQDVELLRAETLSGCFAFVGLQASPTGVAHSTDLVRGRPRLPGLARRLELRTAGVQHVADEPIVEQHTDHPADEWSDDGYPEIPVELASHRTG